MHKPNSLRQTIETALPELAANPDKLSLFVENGHISANKATLSHIDHYTLSVLITDFIGDIDILKTTVIHWLQTHQPDILGAGSVETNAIRFECDILSHDSADVLIQLKLSERVNALLDDKQQIHISHAPEPQHIPDLTGIFGKLYGKSEDWTP